jgi:hypothetical protein
MATQKKPKITTALDSIQKKFDKMVASGQAKVDEKGELYVHISSLESFSNACKKQGVSVKLIGDLSGEFVGIGLRAFIKLDTLGRKYKSAGDSFTILSDECETD